MTLRIKIEVPADGGPYEAKITESNGNPARILAPGESVELHVHSSNSIYVTELPAGAKAAAEVNAPATIYKGANVGPSELMRFEAHELRVIAEKTDLDNKIAKLNAFTASPTFAAMDPADQRLLRSQLVAMGGYTETLRRRIERFAPVSGSVGESEASQ